MAARIEEQPNYTTIDELPQTYIDAVLSVEDKRFYDHFGVDPIAVGRAFFNDVKAGAYVEGGSTITQQLAKISILRRIRRSYGKWRKCLWRLRSSPSLTKIRFLSCM